MKLDELRERVPGAAHLAAEIVVDNPVQCAVLASAVVLVPRVAVRLVRPRTFGEALALFVLLQAGLTYGLGKAVTSGLVPLYLRNDGCRIPLHGGIVTHKAGCAHDHADPAR
jgi:hypothetical protein